MKKEIPLLMKGFLVNQVIAGAKTQTRRVIDHMLIHSLISQYEIENMKSASDWEIRSVVSALGGDPDFTDENEWEITNGEEWIGDIPCPYKPGDLIWIREKSKPAEHYGFDYELVQYWDGATNAHCPIPDPDQIRSDGPWTPAIHMKKKDCRVWLEIISVRPERILDISPSDSIAEGIEECDFDKVNKCRVFKLYGWANACGDEKSSFYSLWEQINGKGSVDLNPWVWVIKFKQIEKGGK